MSMFLAPIHSMMYNKVHIQDEFATKLVESLGNEAILNELNLKAAPTQKGNLEDVIDTSNIHGWLQNQVNISEVRFAQAIKLLLDNGITIDSMKETMFNLGKKVDVKNIETSQDVFQAMNQIFLDGMPCDHVNSVIDRQDTSLTFERSQNVHESYYKDLNLDPNIYFTLRDSYLSGILSNTKFKIEEKTEDNKTIIKIME